MTNDELFVAFSESLWPNAQVIMESNINVATAAEELLGFDDPTGDAAREFFLRESRRRLSSGLTPERLASIRMGDLMLGAWAAGWRPDGWNEN